MSDFAARTGSLHRTAPASGANSDRAVAYWLLTLCGMVFAMVVLGGVTRLTGSGLSMVEWQLFRWLPPMDQGEWLATFEKYRQSPEYLLVNAGMTLDEFKGIFWLEYFHRLWGRLMGVAFLLPFLFFLWRGMIRRPMVPSLVLLFVLGGAQGALGWYMVKSGLVDQPAVSHYRLAAHLSLALVIYGVMLWIALGLLRRPAEPSAVPLADLHRLRRRMTALFTLICVTILSGAFVAGLKAGLLYNTFPLMDGQLLPPDMWSLSPFWLNFLENHATVQFDHRLLAVTTVAATLLLWAHGRRLALPARLRRGLDFLAAAALAQAGLGIVTLLLAVPVALGAAHQAGALVVFTLALWLLHGVRGEEAARSQS
ncbi:COX15/CtaA family protein [Telmatospirillum sp. J64-1]|uniref:COX15/CtaA family protein n=1 Tax=Telmatospirillum sp. J64-1 TaxID=2502183 RepID=UPI00115EBFE5|nr:COX15/CtaA family protein [Telmatospirillum sp. J64-1]